MDLSGIIVLIAFIAGGVFLALRKIRKPKSNVDENEFKPPVEPDDDNGGWPYKN